MRIGFFIAALFITTTCIAQQPLYPPFYSPSMDVPDWVHLMIKPDANVYEVNDAYNAYYNTHAFEKNNFTQFYKKWRHNAIGNTTDNGLVEHKSPAQREAEWNDYLQRINNAPHAQTRSTWECLGPFETVWDEDNAPASWQVNVYCIDRSLSNPDVLYCGSEGGELFKSIDHGLTWTCVSRTYNMPSGEAIRIHPTNPDIIYFGGDHYIYKTTDDGITWNIIYTQTDFNASAILINPTNPLIILACGNKGLIRSIDGGANWTSIYNTRVWDLQFKPGDPTIVYAAKHNSTTDMCELFKSTDSGVTFSIRDNGWYTSSDPDKQDGGCRLAVTPADPNVVYAHLIGQSKIGDNGFIGVWRSNDSGETWSLPHGQIGSPYNCTDANDSTLCPYPNITTIGSTGTYNQGFYNSDIVASSTDANKIIIGGCSLWRSNDGGATFKPIGGYSGQVGRVHPDIQDLLAVGNEVWLASDGGVNFSTDFMATHVSRKNGITSSDFWGFDNGWNDDVMVGGRYHNGNTALTSDYPAGTGVRLGGGEAATGYLNPGNAHHAYFSDIGNLTVPHSVSDAIEWLSSSSSYPNEAYWESEYSGMKFDPHCYNVVWIGKDNQVWRSDDGGKNYTLVKTFGSDVDDLVTVIEVSSSNTQIIYALQLKYSNQTSQLWRSTNGGTTWSPTTMPPGYNRVSTFTLDPEDENVLWMAYRNAASTERVYKSVDGGNTWQNLTTTAIGPEKPIAIMCVGGTDGGVYIGTYNTIFYRNNTMSDWQYAGTGLPLKLMTNRFKPFYRDGKIRIAAYSKGLWQSDLQEPQLRPVCRPTVDKYTAFCAADTFYFDDYSMLNHQGASWNWSFENGIPSTSIERNPKVVFNGVGAFNVTLIVTDGNNVSDTGSLQVNVNPFTVTNLQEDFETTFPPTGWKQFSQDNGAPNWNANTSVGGYGTSAQSMFCNNYDNNAEGKKDDFGFGCNLTNVDESYLTFDVAYARWSGGYPDSLQVLASTDCGLNYSVLYTKSGTDLATAPDNTSEIFVPTPTQWRTDTVQLDSFIGNDNVVIAFRNIGHWGQPIYIDNVNLHSDISINTPITVTKALSVYPTLLCAGENITIVSGENGLVDVFASNGKRVLRQAISIGKSKIQLPVDLASGVYTYYVQTTSQMQNGKIVVQ